MNNKTLLAQEKVSSSELDTEMVAYFDQLNARLETLNRQESLNPKSAESKVVADFRQTLHTALSQVCAAVPGFERLAVRSDMSQIPERQIAAAEEEFKSLVRGDICLETVRKAIDAGCFTNFEEFEFAIFRLIQQTKGHLQILRDFFDQKCS